MDTTAVTRLVRVSWITVGTICERVSAAELDPRRLDGLFEIGLDEVSWRKHHRYLSLVSDHRRGKFVWGAEGRDAGTADAFFDELGPERAAQLAAVSMDMSAGYEKSVRAAGHAPQALICFDPFHVVALATKALDEVRRSSWNELRRLDRNAATKFKGARWALLKNPRQAERAASPSAPPVPPPRRGPLAGVHAERGAACDLPRRPRRSRGGGAARSLLREGPAQRPGALRDTRPDAPQTSRWHSRVDPSRALQRPPRGARQQGPAHHPPGLRVPLRQGRACAGDARLRADHAAATARDRPTSGLGEPKYSDMVPSVRQTSRARPVGFTVRTPELAVSSRIASRGRLAAASNRHRTTAGSTNADGPGQARSS